MTGPSETTSAVMERAMKNCLTVLTALTLCAAAGTVHAQGSAEAGQNKSATCAACHGADGNSVNPEWPSLAGQHANYLVKQLKAFQKGQRENVLMTSQAAGLSVEDMADLAAYYASQTATGREADAKLVSLGEAIYRGGAKDTHVTACTACHGPSGRGNLPAGYPVVAGQHAKYLETQLHAYADGNRKSDPGQMMRNIAKVMSDEQIKAVSSYIQGLRVRGDLGYLVE